MGVSEGRVSSAVSVLLLMIRKGRLTSSEVGRYHSKSDIEGRKKSFSQSSAIMSLKDNKCSLA